jgi:uncharacterized glyoxalase superfamily protein PhnB
MDSKPHFQAEGQSTLAPYLIVAGADELMAFMRQVLGAQDRRRIATADGAVMHAEMQVGDSVVMLGDTGPNAPLTTAMLHVYVPDVEAAYGRALAAGAAAIQPPSDQPHGDRMAAVKDPFGNTWWLATHVAAVPPEEIQARYDEARQPAG